MGIASHPYLERHRVRFIDDPVSEECGIIVTIPCHDEPDVVSSIRSLAECDYPGCNVEVIVLINASESDSESIKQQNLSSADSLVNFKELPEWLKVFVKVDNDLPTKHAGVGLARKMAMDEAAGRFASIEMDRGVIACFDADSLCQKNYLFWLRKHFEQNPKSPGCSIRYEHPLHGEDYNREVLNAIVQYELHLRYYNQAQRYSEYPRAFHTVGSSMAVTAEAYMKAGGMNRRQAGEDFYFLHKVIALGDFSELNDTCIIPSPRPSLRVPFGTGKAVHDMLSTGESLMTYSPQTFEDLKELFQQLPQASNSRRFSFSTLPETIQEFVGIREWENRINSIIANSTNPQTFTKRFLLWFDAFIIMKFAHFCRDNNYPNVPVEKASASLLEMFGIPSKTKDSRELLELYRSIESSAN